MDTVHILPKDSLGKRFIPQEYIPPGKDEYYLRNRQISPPPAGWRSLRSDELERLVKNNNYADNWDDFLVSDPFYPDQIKNNRFYGLIRLGSVRDVILEYHDLQLPVGITNSLIISSDIGNDCAIHDVHYLAHYIIGNRSILFNLDEMHTTDHAKFGNGILKQGEPEDIRVWLDIMNETGCRKVLPFDGMITADAYLWAKYRDDSALLSKLKELTQNRFDPYRGYYGSIGEQCVIKNSRILKDVKTGDFCYIKGANKLKNLTINSSREEPSQIGEGVELVNGIIGFGCHIFYGCKAVRFIIGNNSNLKYGARLINSFLGDNSTISCCEVLNNLIFPAHEQHHNNSFLIASLVMGQSNMAAGATIGSNHNSRANDNEIVAGRGFWPGLCTSLKHSSRFASYVLISKADYPAELDIPFPFALVNNNYSSDRLEVTPAFWWIHNMYALARNSWKFLNRDKRFKKIQHIEFNYLAPDTAEEIIHSLYLLELWTGKLLVLNNKQNPSALPEDIILKTGRDFLLSGEPEPEGFFIYGEGLEKTLRPSVILHPRRSYQAYREMLLYYAFGTIIARLNTDKAATLSSIFKEYSADPQRDWVNLGGQLVPKRDIDKLREDIGAKGLKSWEEIHGRYDALWNLYPEEKLRHSIMVLTDILGYKKSGRETLNTLIDDFSKIQEYIKEKVYLSRKKDFENPFRQATFRNRQEMDSAIGVLENNDFVKQINGETEKILKDLSALRNRY